MQKTILLLLVSAGCLLARPVEVHNYVSGPLCLSTLAGYYYLPGGRSLIELPDGDATLSTTQGMVTVSIAGAQWEGVRVVVSGSEALPVASVEPYKVPWWYLLAGMGFMLPVVGFGLFSRVVGGLFRTSGEPVWSSNSASGLWRVAAPGRKQWSYANPF
jgi:hypothetical protein